MQIIRTFGHLLGGTLLVAGITLGVGMLALPVATAQAGFLPSMLTYFVCWLFMLCTGLLILEACIWMPKDSNLITMAAKLLGKGGKVSCWILYLFLFTCLMVAHVAGGGQVVNQLTGGLIPSWLSLIIYVIAFAPVVYMGTHSVDRLNLFLIAGVAITYLYFVFSTLPLVNLSQLGRADWPKTFLALPVVFTAFGYQSLIPTLMTYMNRNIQKVRLAIILGTSIPLIIYIIWEFLILGVVPLEGSQGLLIAFKQGQNAVTPLQHFLNSAVLIGVSKAFAFFVLTTSFIGISVAFVDFLADGFHVKKTGFHKILLCALIFGVPTIVSLFQPHIFLTALSHAGGIGVALLLGAMPILMVWSGRYYKGYSLLHQQIPGGKMTLSVLLAFVVMELFIEALQ